MQKVFRKLSVLLHSDKLPQGIDGQRSSQWIHRTFSLTLSLTHTRTPASHLTHHIALLTASVTFPLF